MQIGAKTVGVSFPSPNGAQDDSPGQRPGFTGQKQPSPLRAKQNRRIRQCKPKTENVPPFQGWGNSWGRKPRASLRFALGYHLAGLQPFGISVRASRGSLENKRPGSENSKQSLSRCAEPQNTDKL